MESRKRNYLNVKYIQVKQAYLSLGKDTSIKGKQNYNGELHLVQVNRVEV